MSENTPATTTTAIKSIVTIKDIMDRMSQIAVLIQTKEIDERTAKLEMNALNLRMRGFSLLGGHAKMTGEYCEGYIETLGGIERIDDRGLRVVKIAPEVKEKPEQLAKPTNVPTFIRKIALRFI